MGPSFKGRENIFFPTSFLLMRLTWLPKLEQFYLFLMRYLCGGCFACAPRADLKADVHMQSEYVENNQVFGVSVWSMLSWPPQ